MPTPCQFTGFIPVSLAFKAMSKHKSKLIDVSKYLPELRSKAAQLLIRKLEEEIKKLKKLVR